MSRFAHNAVITLTLLVALFILASSNDVAVVPAASTASSTSFVLLEATSSPALESSNRATVGSTTVRDVKAPEKVTKVPAKVPKTAPTAVAPMAHESGVATAPQTPPSGNAQLDAAASVLRSALVNILCYVSAGSGLHSISGSGIIVDPKGIVLTNAHIAQYFLLTDRDVSCTIRAGSPAVDKYKAALIYLSPAWIRANPNVLTQALPSGTGEYDFAFLAITKSATSNPLPSSFPSIPLAQLPPSSGTPVVIASYGAQFLESTQIQSALFPTIVFGSIKDVFTFATNTIDVLSLGGSAAAQEGSSGGGVTDSSGSLVGTITTSTVEGATDTRSLGAISASYIRVEYAREMGSSLELLLSEPTEAAVADFAPQIPLLEAIITTQLH